MSDRPVTSHELRVVDEIEANRAAAGQGDRAQLLLDRDAADQYERDFYGRSEQ